MSLQKIKSAKNITYSDRYSKNPIINTLIKNKLQTEMVSIKESFAHIIKKDSEDANGKSATRMPLRRNKSYSINPKAINQALQYDPVQRLTRYTEQFIAQRQVDSFLIPPQQLKNINLAREQSEGLTTKLKKADVIRYDKSENSAREINGKVWERTVGEFQGNVWLPGKPEVEYLIENRIGQIQEENTSGVRGRNQENIRSSIEKLGNKITGRASNLDSSSKKLPHFPLDSFKPPTPTSQNLKPTTYTPQKYHKNDYKLLQQWLDSTIETISKQHSSPQDMLNLVYSAYICVWKEIIRLTYIESEEKGLIVEKMWYSVLRLFWGLISEQQALARSYQKESEAEHEQIKKLMEHRMEELNRRHVNQVKQIDELKKTNHKLSKVFISFEKVNHQLVQQLQKMTQEKKKYEREFYNIGNSYFKTLELLYDKKLVQMDFVKQQSEVKTSKKGSSEYKTYFLFDKNSKPVVLGRFKYEDNAPNAAPRYDHDALKQTVSQQLKLYNERYGHNLKQIQNELTRYWSKKQDDLEMKGIINSLIMDVKIKDVCVGTAKVDKEDFQCQFPQNQENYVEKLLADLRNELTIKFQIQRKHYQTQIQQKEDMLQRWKLSSQQMQEKNKILIENNARINQNLKKSKQGAGELVKQIDTFVKQIEDLKQQIKRLKNDLQVAKVSEQSAKNSEQSAIKQRQTMRAELQRQKQNNKMLVRGNLQMKQKVQKFEIKFNTLVKSVKAVAPWLQKMMAQVDKPPQQINFTLLKTVSGKIQQNLSQYVTKDSGLFMTRLT